MVSFNNINSLFINFREKIITLIVGNNFVDFNFYVEHVWNFLVRSGILNSVHTFANDPQRGLFILIFLFSLIFLSLFIFIFFTEPIIQKIIIFFG